MPEQPIDVWMRSYLKIPLSGFATSPVHKDILFVRAESTLYHRYIYRSKCRLSNFHWRLDPAGTGDILISGLAWYIAKHLNEATLAKRINLRNEVEAAVRKLSTRDFEGLSSKILGAWLDESQLTKSTRDKGRDVLGKKRATADHMFESLLTSIRGSGSENYFVTASCKHQRGGGAENKKPLEPMFIRDLVGTWSIEKWAEGEGRSEVRLATALKSVIVTSYRLSDESWGLCSKCGLEVVTLPDIVAFVCKYAPSSVFPGRRMVDQVALLDWVRT